MFTRKCNANFGFLPRYQNSEYRSRTFNSFCEGYSNKFQGNKTKENRREPANINGNTKINYTCNTKAVYAVVPSFYANCICLLLLKCVHLGAGPLGERLRLNTVEPG